MAFLRLVSAATVNPLTAGTRWRLWGGVRDFPLIRTRLRSYGLEALASSGDLNDFDQVCTPDVAREWRQNLEGFAFNDRDFTVEDMIADDTKVAILWTNTGTHTGEYAGAPATGMRTSDKGSAFFTFDGDGKIAAVVSYFDAESLFRQLGATISPPPSNTQHPDAGSARAA